MTRIDTSHPVDFDAVKAAMDTVSLPRVKGEVTSARDPVVEGTLPGARIGMTVSIQQASGSPVVAEVAAFEGPRVTLLPLRPFGHIGPGSRIVSIAGQHHIPCGEGLMGRVIDCLGTPVDGGVAIPDTVPWPISREAPDPLKRQPVDRQLVTGIRVLDGCLGIGLGQRIGLFSGPGLGKTTLLGLLAKRAESDVNVICLVGERGREVSEFIEKSLGDDGRKRSVVVLAPVDAPPQTRVRALDAATAIAEWFRSRGRHALLLVDSLTRVVRARRDVALSLGESPTRSGYPPSAFSGLPSLIERTGRSASGSITAVYTVLTEGRGDPVAEEARSLLDGHIVLSEKLARRGRWPAVDVLRSVSRVAESIYHPGQQAMAARLRQLLGAYDEHEDLILMGAYRRGTSADTDAAMDKKSAIDAYLGQTRDETTALDETFRRLSALVGP